MNRVLRVRGHKHLHAARRMIDRLLHIESDHATREYLAVLTDLVEAFEDEHESFADVSEAEVLRELMRANSLSQPRLAKAVGISQSTISAVLNGTRSLTKDHVITLA